MRKISEQELKDILDKHGKWLRGEENGERADLSYANLSYANLRSVDLRSADLSSADLRSADLSSADLRSADLSLADLSLADLSLADLSYANLRYANLIIFQFQRHMAYYTFDDSLRIGCECLPITEWIESFESIGLANGYTEKQIKMYGQFIKMCFNHFKENNK